MHRTGALPDEVYHKFLVSLAYEFSQADEVLRAVALLQSVPVEYFQNSLITQMKEDSNFAHVAYSVAKAVHDSGVSLSDAKLGVMNHKIGLA